VRRLRRRSWVGGGGAAARRRVVALADGWMPFAQNRAMADITGTPPIQTVDDLAALVKELDEERTAAGRPERLDVCFGPPRRSAINRRDASDAEVDEELAAFLAAGATWLTLQSRAKTPDDLNFEMDRWAPLLARHRAGFADR